MYFPEQRLAVFCDSNRHHRGAKTAQKDALVSEQLLEAEDELSRAEAGAKRTPKARRAKT